MCLKSSNPFKESVVGWIKPPGAVYRLAFAPSNADIDGALHHAAAESALKRSSSRPEAEYIGG